MSKKKQSQGKSGVHIEIGGSVGPASAVGKGNKVVAHNVAGGNVTQKSGADNATLEHFLALIQELRTQVSQLEEQFETEDAKDVEDRLERVAELSTREKPPAERIKRDLETVSEIVKDTVATGAAITPLLPIVQQAWEIFLHLFGK